MTYQDVALLERSMENLGGAFRNRRLDAERMSQQGIENELRQKMLERQTAHETRMETAADAANKTTTDRNVMQDKQRLLQTVMALNAGGQLDDAGLGSVNDWLSNDEHFSQVGLHLAKPPKKPSPQVGQNSVAQALKMAEEFRAQGKEDYAALLERWAKKQSEETATETTEDKFPASEGASHTEGGFLGIGGKRVVDSPETPERVVRTTRKVTATAPQSSKLITDKKGRKWNYKGSLADPTQDKDPSHWEAVP